MFALVRAPAMGGSFYPVPPRSLGEPSKAFSPRAELAQRQRSRRRCGAAGVAGRALASVAASGQTLRAGAADWPSYYSPLTGIAAPSADAFATPLGEIPVDVAAINALKRADLVHTDDAAHEPKHSLEVELPFLQKALASFRVVPLLVGHAIPHLVARIIKSLTDERTLLVVSTDLSHYLDDAAAQ
jgi:AmmeMemoRadiSam system protein B